MMKDLECVLYTKEEIDARVKELGEQISRDYAGKDPVFVGILKGSFIFMADLVRAVSIPCSMDFMSVSSYGSGTQTTGSVKIIKDLSQDIEGKDVIMVAQTLIMYADVVRQDPLPDGSWSIGLAARKFSTDVLQYLFDGIEMRARLEEGLNHE